MMWSQESPNLILGPWVLIPATCTPTTWQSCTPTQANDGQNMSKPSHWSKSEASDMFKWCCISLFWIGMLQTWDINKNLQISFIKKTRCQTFWVPHTSLSSSVVYSIGFLHHYIYGIIEYEHNLQYIKSPKNIPKHPRCFRCPAPCLGTLGTCSWSFCLSSVSSVAGGSWRWRWLVNGKNGEMGLPHHDYWVLYHDIIYTYLYMI